MTLGQNGSRKLPNTRATSARRATSRKRKEKTSPVVADEPILKSLKPAVVIAQVDVGFGNALFIRGEGNGLSWEKGMPLECRDGSAWAWATEAVDEEIVFKLLLNDVVWAQGGNITLRAGDQVELYPRF